MKGVSKKKSLFIILAVTALTMYNILPTMFFYSKNLSAPVDKSYAKKISYQIANRVNSLEPESVDWINAYCSLLNISAKSVRLSKTDPSSINVTFASEKSARIFRTSMRKAGLLISFFPKRMTPYELNTYEEGAAVDSNPNVVKLKREIPIHFNTKNLESVFAFGEMEAKDGRLTSEYRTILDNRVLEVAKKVAHQSTVAESIEKTLYEMSPESKIPYFVHCSDKLLEYQSAFSKNSTLEKAFFQSVFISSSYSKEELYNHCLNGIRQSLDIILKDKVALKETLKEQNIDENDLNIEQAASLKNISEKEKTLLKAISVLKNKKNYFFGAETKEQNFSAVIQNQRVSENDQFSLATNNINPVISSVNVDYSDRKVDFAVNKELLAYIDSADTKTQRECRQIIFEEVARLKETTSENIESYNSYFSLNLSNLNNARSFLKMDLTPICKNVVSSLTSTLNNSWKRTSKQLSKESYPVLDFAQYNSLEDHQKPYNLVVYAPTLHGKETKGFSKGSIFIIGKDMMSLINNSKDASKEASAELYSDIRNLQTVLAVYNARTVSGNSYPYPKEFQNDVIFEIKDYYATTLSATREEWNTHGLSNSAILEFSDRKNRILTTNKIEDAEHADLLKWQDDYNKSYMNKHSEGYQCIPKPTKSPLISNLSLSFSKYFRGDQRKILHWGLDLNGGTTVKVALKDKHGQKVTTDAEIHQGINELYRRVNKLGVSDVSIRKEGAYITLDFPSTQNVSAEELISSSSMTLHVVNEKFSRHNYAVSDSVSKFLQEVWNEALVTGQKDMKSINQIAFSHLYGDNNDRENPLPRSSSAKILLDNGLAIADPNSDKMSNNLNDTLSMIGLLDGDGYQAWHGQTNPLVILFHNYALAGAALSNVQSGYEPTSGNYLNFSVKGSLVEDGKTVNPRDSFYNWTSIFSTAEIASTKYGQITNGKGWRLAPVLNGRILSMPTLGDALRDGGRISGSFTQKEIRGLTADLKAGSLTYTPEIISETTISPELGLKDRYQGIFATIIAFLAVLVIMIGYYRFAGIIASLAVVFNILIIWGTLQNLGASLTLAGIAGVILTIGMAVDANVLIFERIREEQEIQKSVVQAISNGYKKAFSAIFDSNITTIIAALILLNFDSGPVKGFALTLIIGIVSSMFTALYMTRTFFSFWAKNDSTKKLSMMNLIPNTGFPFLKYGRAMIFGSLALGMVGLVSLYSQRNTIFGMDFTGGMTVQLEVKHSANELSSKQQVENALLANGFKQSEFQIRELNNASNLKLFFSNTLKAKGRPFGKMPEKVINPEFSFQRNSKLAHLVSVFSNSGIELTTKSLNNLDKNFTNISGQMSDTMRNNAVFGLILALGAILIYLTFRFEFAYALSATIGLGFDLLLTIAVLGIATALGVPLTIDLTTIAALMTIIGYSLNDTIIVFDRIRAESKHSKKGTEELVINNSINSTLSRTIMTSLTTLVVLLSLVTLGGRSIFGFSFIMTAGVIIGTVSTLFISSSFLFMLKRKKKQKIESKIIPLGVHK